MRTESINTRFPDSIYLLGYMRDTACAKRRKKPSSSVKTAHHNVKLHIAHRNKDVERER